ncbi:MAG TPA: P27 family phage terminase small subunit [Terracidiphilus sp.]|nr:P27 family phage terminase small subunit [Terracidiphilus sp.]
MARLPNQNMRPGRPAKPPGLTKRAGQEWDRLVSDLEESGIQVAKVHGRLIELASKIFDAMADAQETIDTEGPYYENPKTGAMQLHPATRRLDSLGRDYVKVLSILGLRSVAATPITGESLEDILDGEE